MKKRIVLLFAYSVLFIPGLSAQEDIREWDYNLYEKYNYKQFFKLPLANTIIKRDSINYKLLHAAIFYCTNKARKKNNLSVFKHSMALEKAAFEHSKDMVEYDFFSHVSPVKGKETMKERLERVGLNNTSAAENIFENFSLNQTYLELAQSFVDGWMKSPGHRKNIVNPRYKYLGCGAFYFFNPEWKEYLWFRATQNFSSNDNEVNHIIEF